MVTKASEISLRQYQIDAVAKQKVSEETIASAVAELIVDVLRIEGEYSVMVKKLPPRESASNKPKS